MEQIFARDEIIYENQQANNLSILAARFKGGYSIHFLTTPDHDLRCTLKGIFGENVDKDQRGVAGIYFAKVGEGQIIAP